MTGEELGKTIATILISNMSAQDFADEVIEAIEIGRNLGKTVASHVYWLKDATRLARQLEGKIAAEESAIDYDGAFHWVISEWHPETCDDIFKERCLELTAESALKVLLGTIEGVSSHLSALLGCYGDDDPTDDVWGGSMGVEE